MYIMVWVLEAQGANSNWLVIWQVAGQKSKNTTLFNTKTRARNLELFNSECKSDERALRV